MFTGRNLSVRVALAGVMALMLAACGSPSAPTASVSAPAGPTSSPSSSGSALPAPTPVEPILVIRDIVQNEIRLARLDATDVATVKGQYEGIVSGKVIVINGSTLEAVGPTGAVKTLGRLTGTPQVSDSGGVAVKPDMSQWLYTVTDDSWTSRIHLGTASGDSIVATIPSPDGNAFYEPFVWNGSGVYMVKAATGLGGAGPFLEYNFNLAKFDLASHRVADVTPACIVHAVLDDGTAICGQSYTNGQLEVRSASGSTHVIQVATGKESSNSAIWKVHVSPDGKRLIAGRNGAKDPVVNYQMAVANLSDAGAATPFGPLDYNPNTWLADGRLVADHECVFSDWGAGPCSASLDGTYIFSADGKSQTLFYRLKSGWVVGSI